MPKISAATVAAVMAGAATPAERGTPDPDLACRLVGGPPQAAMPAVAGGADLAATTGRALDLVHHGIDRR